MDTGLSNKFPSINNFTNRTNIADRVPIAKSGDTLNNAAICSDPQLRISSALTSLSTQASTCLFNGAEIDNPLLPREKVSDLQYIDERIAQLQDNEDSTQGAITTYQQQLLNNPEDTKSDRVILKLSDFRNKLSEIQELLKKLLIEKAKCEKSLSSPFLIKKETPQTEKARQERLPQIPKSNTNSERTKYSKVKQLSVTSLTEISNAPIYQKPANTQLTSPEFIKIYKDILSKAFISYCDSVSSLNVDYQQGTIAFEQAQSNEEKEAIESELLKCVEEIEKANQICKAASLELNKIDNLTPETQGYANIVLNYAFTYFEKLHYDTSISIYEEYYAKRIENILEFINNQIPAQEIPLHSILPIDSEIENHNKRKSSVVTTLEHSLTLNKASASASNNVINWVYEHIKSIYADKQKELSQKYNYNKKFIECGEQLRKLATDIFASKDSLRYIKEVDELIFDFSNKEKFITFTEGLNKTSPNFLSNVKHILNKLSEINDPIVQIDKNISALEKKIGGHINDMKEYCFEQRKVIC